MTSYFEIAGEIIECHDVLTSPEFKTFVKEVAVPLSSAAIEARAEAKTPVSREKDSLFVHWLKTSTVPLRKMGPSMLITKGSIKNPYVFAVQGIGVISTVPGMHYDYFVKGESHGW
jgi:hypothetical protein